MSDNYYANNNLVLLIFKKKNQLIFIINLMTLNRVTLITRIKMQFYDKQLNGYIFIVITKSVIFTCFRTKFMQLYR